jgi:lipid-A-disaccharide synthase
MHDPGTILVTAFEPSGDAHAAPMIRAIRERSPETRILALGGPRMAEAGAEMLEMTVEDAAMGLDALGKIRWLKGILGRLEARLPQVRPVVHVPVDSPAANFPICRRTRAAGARIVHLVAPQLWAWGPWRIGKLRRLTDGVLCLLPFEPAWFAARGVPARFIGHPRLQRPVDEAAVRARAAALGIPGAAPGDGRRRLVLLPGSRRHEVERNREDLVQLAARLQRSAATRGQDLAVTCSPTTEAVGRRMREAAGAVGLDLGVWPGELDAVVLDADLALLVSGTVSLDVARLGTPMVGVFRVRRASAMIARVLLRTPDRLLPNLVAGERIVPEFVPWAGGLAPIERAAESLLADPALADRQRRRLGDVRASSDGHDAEAEAAEAVLAVARGERFPAEPQARPTG